MSDIASELVDLRRSLHRIPELSFHEHETGRLLRETTGRWATPRPIAKTGFTIDLGPAEASRTLLLRADMDGLPITEETGLPYASTHAGRMHACGHDGHMAALVVAGRLLHEAPPGGVRVRLLFQPSEEAGGGARACIEAGVLDDVDAAFGIHLWNELPLGTVALTSGGIMAGVVELDIEVVGHGGHGAMPDRTRDPVVAAAQLIMTLQTVASRRIDPVEPVVLTIGSVQGGEAFNVIPGRVKLRGTVRAYSDEVLHDVQEEMGAIAYGVGAATGTRIELSWKLWTRPVVNDRRVAAMAVEATSRMAGLGDVRTDYRTMAGEDFGEILREVPGCFALVGSANAARGLVEPHHSPRFEFDESALRLACDLHRAVATEFAENGIPALD